MTVEYKDYYKILGLAKSVGKDELKKQYRKLARKYHPDVNTTDKNAGARFAEISEAYEVLSDDEKRKKYDALGSDWERYSNTDQAAGFDWSKYASSQERQEKESGPRWEDIFGSQSGGSDFFSSMFGQASGAHRSQRASSRGSDLRAELAISLEEAYEGGVKIITVGNRKIRLNLKPGIWDKQTIKIADKGAAGANGTASGDLYLTFAIMPHKEYRLEGVDLFRDISVSVYAAMLGTTFQVKTISGTFKLTIRPETRNGTILKLKSKGFPVYGKAGVQGDLFLRVAIQLPDKLTAREKVLIRELATLRHVQVEAETVTP